MQTDDVRGPDLLGWIRSDLASLQQRFASGIAGQVPMERWKERVESPSGTSSSIAGLILHLAYHQDLAVQCAVLGRPPLLAARREVLGLGDHPAHTGLSEREASAAVDELDITALADYYTSVSKATDRWITRIGTHALATVPPACRRISTKAAVTTDDVPWLHGMWDTKPVSWFLQWEVIGHGYTHLGEMTAIRNQLGLSPF